MSKGKIFREDRQPVPPDALRETILNAVMHRDYSTPGSCVAVAVFDDRIEVRSTGGLPPGITLKMLSRPHASKLRNPLAGEREKLLRASGRREPIRPAKRT